MAGYHMTLLAGLLLLPACTPTAEGVQATGNSLKSAMADNAAAWHDLFTYHPHSTTPQLPQTRYCYKAQTDIVCYDSAQKDMTSQMVGYQDGDNISWVQPGGGSLGASGGEPTAPQNASKVQLAPNVMGTAAVIATGNDDMSPQSNIPTTVTETPQAPAGAGKTPFQKGQSDYVKMVN